MITECDIVRLERLAFALVRLTELSTDYAWDSSVSQDNYRDAFVSRQKAFDSFVNHAADLKDKARRELDGSELADTARKDEVIQYAIRRHSKIEAIKRLRELTNCSLLDAKDVIVSITR